MTALEKWKNDFKEFISELSMPRDDYKGILAYIDEVPNEALEQQPCEDWYDVPSDEMTLEQARQAVKDLRKKLVEYLKQEPCDDCISRSDVKKYLSAPDANGDRVIYESDLDLLPSVTPKKETCEDAVSRQAVLDVLKKHWLEGTVAHRVIDEIGLSINVLPSVTPKEKTGRWIFDEILDKHYYCSECKSMGVDYWDYCPYCGCRMVEPQESEGKE